MADPIIDLDLLAEALQAEISRRQLSLRAAAEEIGCSASTLSRLVQGSSGGTVPDTTNLIRATSWLGSSLSDFDTSTVSEGSTINNVVVHLRALPELEERDKEMLVSILRAAHDSYLNKRLGKSD